LSTSNNEDFSRGTYQLMSVDKHGVGEEIINLYKQGLTYKQMSEMLAKKGISIHPKSIGAWMAAQRADYGKKVDIQTYKKFEEMVFDYKKEITEILTEVKEIKQQAIESKDVSYAAKMDIYVKLVSKLYQGMELLAKIMGDVKSTGQTDIKVIVNEINKSMYIDNKGVRHKLFDKSDVINIEAEILGEEVQKDEEECIVNGNG